jgi:hypothetical protein
VLFKSLLQEDTFKPISPEGQGMVITQTVKKSWPSHVIGVAASLIVCSLSVMAEDIVLPAPRTSGVVANTILANRCETTAFSSARLSRQIISDLVWASCGINRPLDPSNKPGRRTVNYSFNSRENDVYLACAEGIFMYSPTEHSLSSVSDEDVRPLISAQAATAPMTIILAADYARTSDQSSTPIHTGFCAENIELYCAGKDIGVLVSTAVPAALHDKANMTASQNIFLLETIGYREGASPSEEPWETAAGNLPAARVDTAPVLKILKERRSTGSFASTGLSLQTLSELLWAGCGVNNTETGERTVPLVGGYDIDLYVALSSGVFVYRPGEDPLLVQVSTDDIRSQFGDSYKNAPATFIYVSDYTRLPNIADKNRYSGYHIGFVGQNVSVYCADQGIGQKIRSSMPASSTMTSLLHLTADQHPRIVQTIGYPSSAPGNSAVTFSAGTNGSVTGSTSQSIAYRGNGTSVTAVPADGYVFSYWSGMPGGKNIANPLALSNVVCPMNIVANFAEDQKPRPVNISSPRNLRRR